MKLLRTLSTSRLLLLALTISVLAAGVAAIAVAASGGSGPTPPPKPLANALHDALAAPAPQGITARIKFTNKLFPSGALTGRVGSPLMSGASGRLWATNDGRGRLELQSSSGDVQIVWNQNEVKIFDASSNTIYHAQLPSQEAKSHDKGTLPSLAEIQNFLSHLGTHVSVSGAQSTDVANQAAYSVRISPKHDGGLLGAAELAFDSNRGVPLRIGIYAQNATAPVIELAVSKISYGTVAASDVTISPPANAKSVDLGALTRGAHERKHAGSQAHLSGLRQVQTHAGFTVIAPATLVGLPRQDVRLVGHTGSQAALVVYGQGLGAILVVEHKAAAGGASIGPLGSLPTVSLDGATGHELATQLGTALTWQRGGVDFVLAGSLPTAAAETAARALK